MPFPPNYEAKFDPIWVNAAEEKQRAINPGVLQICVSAASVDLEGQEELGTAGLYEHCGKKCKVPDKV